MPPDAYKDYNNYIKIVQNVITDTNNYPPTPVTNGGWILFFGHDRHVLSVVPSIKMVRCTSS